MMMKTSMGSPSTSVNGMQSPSGMNNTNTSGQGVSTGINGSNNSGRIEVGIGNSINTYNGRVN